MNYIHQFHSIQGHKIPLAAKQQTLLKLLNIKNLPNAESESFLGQLMHGILEFCKADTTHNLPQQEEALQQLSQLTEQHRSFAPSFKEIMEFMHNRSRLFQVSITAHVAELFKALKPELQLVAGEGLADFLLENGLAVVTGTKENDLTAQVSNLQIKERQQVALNFYRTTIKEKIVNLPASQHKIVIQQLIKVNHLYNLITRSKFNKQLTVHELSLATEKLFTLLRINSNAEKNDLVEHTLWLNLHHNSFKYFKNVIRLGSVITSAGVLGVGSFLTMGCFAVIDGTIRYLKHNLQSVELKKVLEVLVLYLAYLTISFAICPLVAWSTILLVSVTSTLAELNKFWKSYDPNGQILTTTASFKQMYAQLIERFPVGRQVSPQPEKNYYNHLTHQSSFALVNEFTTTERRTLRLEALLYRDPYLIPTDAEYAEQLRSTDSIQLLIYGCKVKYKEIAQTIKDSLVANSSCPITYNDFTEDSEVIATLKPNNQILLYEAQALLNNIYNPNTLARYVDPFTKKRPLFVNKQVLFAAAVV